MTNLETREDFRAPVRVPQPRVTHARKMANLAAFGPAIVMYFVAREVLTRVMRAVEAKPADRSRDRMLH